MYAYMYARIRLNSDKSKKITLTITITLAHSFRFRSKWIFFPSSGNRPNAQHTLISLTFANGIQIVCTTNIVHIKKFKHPKFHIHSVNDDGEFLIRKKAHYFCSILY